MSNKDHILCVDDDQDHLALFERVLTRLGYSVVTSSSSAVALNELEASHFDAVVTDLGMAEMDGLELCERVVATKPDTPVIVLTGAGSMDTAMAALRVGAYDFLTKPIDDKLLGISVMRAVKHAKLRSQLQQLKVAVAGVGAEHGLIGSSPPMRALIALINRVGKTEVSVVIQGETGTGKELVARAIHAVSPRCAKPFVALNCAAVPPTLLESELFGHAKGAFTDASSARQGLFVEAGGGTLFLDEIGDMPLEMQAKLLRVLQERKVRPVGSNTEIECNVRIITATHRDLETEVEQGRFRSDLYYRINVVRIDVPALRERGSDVLTLAAHFLHSTGARGGKGKMQLGSQAAERLLSYDWPGNVRELENCIERAVALARFDHLAVEDLPERIRAYRDVRFSVTLEGEDELISLDLLQQRYILRTLELVAGNKARAAQLLGLDRRTLYRKLESYAVPGTLDTDVP
ncbi:MAG TPA: sigma-54 dependent transcriptional regulator [Polyangiales bacterium]|nr:sigma-54 dependent transcriptional regulator [Polyangiales bacterium]